MTEPGGNLAALMSAWAALIREGDDSELQALLDPEVIWQGLLPELVCNNRRQVTELLTGFARRAPRITRFEGEEIGDRVAFYVEGPDFPENEVLPAAAPRVITFTFRDGRVVRMESLQTREAAFSR